MRQPRAKQIAFVVQKNLGFVDQTPKGGAVDDTVAVSGELGARGSGRLWETAATRLIGVTSVIS
jgi:hypothetical protein